MEKWSEYKKEIKSLSEDEKIYLELLADIVTARVDKNITQRELAELTGLKQPAIGRLESPTTHSANLRTVIKYLDALDMKLQVIPKNN
ncbi:helix-turn-helix transcriptional regulator [uncultured Metabacillus sp.]|uniref:helix-turn-helix domain-containing protein n=1 Tax=uncultured Metabacillus sp. TaxID=2860135 RepID=UPI002614EC88|nr:helix-turn-helix transcriptional regulator [uncultured Metabacillus sp.]